MKKQERAQKKSFPLAILVACALLSALSILFGKYLAINLGESIRISFENLPILFTGFFFGPVAGALTGAVADLVGCLLVGYSINPIITVGAMIIGIIPGLIGRIRCRTEILSIILSVFFAHLIGSVIVKTLGLHLLLGAPLLITLLWRSLTYLLVGILEGACLCGLASSRALKKQIRRISPAHAARKEKV